MKLATLSIMCGSVAIAAASPARLPPDTTYPAACPDHTCKGRIAADANGRPIVFAEPMGYVPSDIQGFYHVDPTLGSGLTVAVIDAFGDTTIEADLAVYRSTFGLPPCTVASGCFQILDSIGQPSNLPDSDTTWFAETSLDVEMVSAVCPLCKIVLIQADGDDDTAFDVGQRTLGAITVDAISDSWGLPDKDNPPAYWLNREGDFALPGIATFASVGDDGYDSGAEYPSTSSSVIAVGGTSVTDVGSVAWSGSQGGCSTAIAAQPWTPVLTVCSMRATADISALADPTNGVAIYTRGTWQVYGGTSAASPISAALFAAAGHADARPAFVYKHADAFTDVTQGMTGSCGTVLCEAAVGWDGPTGLGEPDQSKLVAIGNVVGAGPNVVITYPLDGDHVDAGFSIQAAPDANAMWIDIQLDGVSIGHSAAAPWTVATQLNLAEGTHTITVIAYDLDHNSQSATAGVTVGTDTDMAPGGGGGCCSTSGSPGAGALFIAGVLVMRRRRRRGLWQARLEPSARELCSRGTRAR
jgi:hypothetical protein